MSVSRSTFVSCAAGLFALALGACGQGVPTPRPSSPATPSPTASPTPVSVATLTHDTWSPIPTAPLAARYSEVGVWDGKELIVWGGTSIAKPQKLMADGAAYSPTTRQWTKQPVSPLSARDDAAAVWTGTDLFLWGGTTTNSLNGDTNGALYDPSTHVWSMLPPAPLPSGEYASATWTGTNVVVVVDVPSSNARETFSRVAAATFTPTTHTWHALPSLNSVQGHTIVQTEVVEDSGSFTLFDGWENLVTTPGTLSILSVGVDVETVDSTGGHWTRQLSSSNLTGPVASRPPGFLSTPIATPYGVYFPPVFQCAMNMNCPDPFGDLNTVSGYLYDPSHHQWSFIPATPVSTASPVTVWSGDAAIAVTTGPGLSNVTIPAGTTTAYTPHTNTWTTLARDPDTVGESIAVWCSDRIIIFGDVAPTSNSVPVQAMGIQLGP